MSVFALRDATAKDASVIYRVTRSAFVEYAGDVPPPSALFETLDDVRREFEEGCGAVVALDVDARAGEPRAVGCVRYRVARGAIHFFRLAVAPSARRRGIAKSLVARVEEIGQAKGCRRATCHVRTGVARNVALYRSMGYAMVGEDMQIRGGFAIRVGVMEKRWEAGTAAPGGDEAK